MLFKTALLIVLLVILLSLGSGLFYLIRDKGKQTRTAKALTVRIVLSLSLFILLFVGMASGWITPHGVNPPLPINSQPVDENKQP